MPTFDDHEAQSALLRKLLPYSLLRRAAPASLSSIFCVSELYLDWKLVAQDQGERHVNDLRTKRRVVTGELLPFLKCQPRTQASFVKIDPKYFQLEEEYKDGKRMHLRVTSSLEDTRRHAQPQQADCNASKPAAKAWSSEWLRSGVPNLQAKVNDDVEGKVRSSSKRVFRITKDCLHTDMFERLSCRHKQTHSKIRR